MFKLTLYKKIKLSRNLLIFLLIFLLVGVGAKVVFAHEKLTTYAKAMEHYDNGEMIAAEELFRKAQLNVFVVDHNADISYKLSILSPVKEELEKLDRDAASAHKDSDLNRLVSLHDVLEGYKIEWLEGSLEAQKLMFEEMVALTDVVEDLVLYFEHQKEKYYSFLTEDATSDREETAYHALQLIPATYYGDEETKEAEILDAFLSYYTMRMDNLMDTESLVAIIDEALRQFPVLDSLALDHEWLEKKVNSFLLDELNTTVKEEEYNTFVFQAKNARRITSKLSDSKVTDYIETTIADVFKKAENYVQKHEYKEAIILYNTFDELQDTSALVKEANYKWDLHEPLRVLKRQVPNKQFDYYIDGRDNWGADSFIAAFASDGSFYFGLLNYGEDMYIIEDGIYDISPQSFRFYNQLAFEGNPVIFFEAASNARKHRYLAYEISSYGMTKILDLEANAFTIDSPNVLLVDNPVGHGEGKFAYYEPSYYNNVYEFSSILVDYVDIYVDDIESYRGEKVRFNAYIEFVEDGYGWIEVDSWYDYDTYEWQYQYVLLDLGNANIYRGYYTIIGKFNKYIDIEDYYSGDTVKVPLVVVEEYD